MDADGELDRGVELPAEFADIGQTRGAHGRVTEIDLLRGAEGKRGIGKVGVGDALQQLARTRPHDRQHREHRRDVGHLDVHRCRQCGDRAPDHVAIAHRLCAAGDDQVLVMIETSDREVALIAATLVEHAGIDRAAGLARDIVGDQPLQHGVRVAALHEQLRERTHVEHGHRFAAGTMFGGHPRMPVLVTPAVFDPCLRGRRRKEIGALPAHLRAEARAGVAQLRIQRRAPERAGRFQFTVRPRHLVVHAEYLGDAVGQPGLVGVEALRSGDCRPARGPWRARPA